MEKKVGQIIQIYDYGGERWATLWDLRKQEQVEVRSLKREFKMADIVEFEGGGVFGGTVTKRLPKAPEGLKPII